MGRYIVTTLSRRVPSKSVALVLEASRNLQLEGVKDHLLFEGLRTELRWSSPETRILAERTTATDFFAYFFHPRKKVGPRWPSDNFLPFPGRRSFLSTPQKGTQKVTAQGTGLSWLALRRREANSHDTGVLRQVPPVAPDAAPSSRPNPLDGSWI